MSVQAMAWAIEQRRETDPTARHLLLAMGNYADKTGRNCFPSVATLASDTGLSERTIRQKLAQLEAAGLIRRGNQRIAEVEIARADRRPVVYNLDLPEARGAAVAPRYKERGAADGVNGVQLTAERGAADGRTGCTSCTQTEVQPRTEQPRAGALARRAPAQRLDASRQLEGLGAG